MVRRHISGTLLGLLIALSTIGGEMIKGKFYTGLPEKMMNRSRGMDRQQTNFYWPDESEAEETTNRKVRPTTARASPMTSATVNNYTSTATGDIKPKELFHKQLSSRIEFYDNVDAKTPEARRRRFKKIDNVNLNNADRQYVPEKKKLETFSSKIEFYDFVDTAKPTEVKRNNAVAEPMKQKQKQKIEIGDEPLGKPIERTDSMKKRISFQVEKASPEKTKSILKNVDGKSQPERMAVKPLPKRGLLPKNMSKSVDNMAKFAKSTEDLNEKSGAEPKSEKLISIIREVKNMNLAEQKQPVRSSAPKNRYVDDYDDDDYGYSHAGHRRTNYQRDDDYGGRERDRISDERRYNSRFQDRYGGEPAYEYTERPYRRDPLPRPNRIEHFEDRNFRRSPQRIVDDYYESHSKRFESPDVRRTPPSRRYDDIDERLPRQSRNVPIDVEPYAESNRRSPPNRMRYEDRPIERKPVDRGQRAYSEQPTNYSPANSGRSHRHLRSNIFFNDDIQQPSNRPLSVRDSAVTRVGVGLPDIWNHEKQTKSVFFLECDCACECSANEFVRNLREIWSFLHCSITFVSFFLFSVQNKNKI